MNTITIVIEYTNHRDEFSRRSIQPISISFGANEWHKEAQWLLKAFDLDKQQIRYFAMKDISSWKPA